MLKTHTFTLQTIHHYIYFLYFTYLFLTLYLQSFLSLCSNSLIIIGCFIYHSMLSPSLFLGLKERVY